MDNDQHGVQAGPHLRAVLPPWLTSRLLVISALGVAHLAFDLVDHRYTDLRLRQGLLAWDGEWIHRIASDGYKPLPDGSLRYFPLLPLMARGLSVVLLGNVGLSLLLLANGFALGAMALLHSLVCHETAEEGSARRATWLLALAPPSFVLAMGYTESLAILLAVGAFLGLRSRRWRWAALAGFLGGLARPLGVLMVIPAAIEALPGVWSDTAKGRLSRLVAVAAPVAGSATWLTWVAVRFGDPLMLYRAQQNPDFRGGLANPLVTMVGAGRDLLTGHLAVKNVPHLPWALILIALVVVVCRRWPPSYGAFAAATLLVALSTERWGSLERYGFACFPVVLAMVSLTSSKRVERVVLVISGALMFGYAVLTFLALYVP